MLLLLFSGAYFFLFSLFGVNREPLNVFEKNIILAAVCMQRWEGGSAGDAALISKPRRNKDLKPHDVYENRKEESDWRAITKVEENNLASDCIERHVGRSQGA